MAQRSLYAVHGQERNVQGCLLSSCLELCTHVMQHFSVQDLAYEVAISVDDDDIQCIEENNEWIGCDDDE